MQKTNSTLNVLLVRFSGQVLIPLISATESVGIPAQTVRNRLSKGIFPIPTVLVGTRRFIHISDLAEFIESQRLPLINTPNSKIIKKGARTKEDRLRAQGRV